MQDGEWPYMEVLANPPAPLGSVKTGSRLLTLNTNINGSAEGANEKLGVK